jgi:hypothetical protein
MYAPNISIYDERLNSRDINAQIGYLQTGNSGEAGDPMVQWEDNDEQEECAMWEALKSDALRNVDERQWNDGVTLVRAEREVIDGQLHVTLPADYAFEYYERIHDSEAFQAMAHYVHWHEVAGDLVTDMAHVSVLYQARDTISYYMEA